ncbi:di-heme oxidoredictase family protein [Nitratireductor sp. XY-223]|uniref:di-heme oxidoreductase family protein n=1 Tax=Nitratireductor sp. XY-223 TaxID=2561926 RepID=UPI0010AA403C|nr:di-heme oxidoredictase family protein [Nitratireductor sp. XY-223]
MRDRWPVTWRHAITLVLIAAVPAVGLAAASAPGARGHLSAAELERVRAVTQPTADFSKPERFEAMPGGATTLRKAAGRKSFSFPAANISFGGREAFVLGEALFEKLWVSAPASTKASDGLGPLFNARACSSCHIRNGRGLAPDGQGNEGSLILALTAGAKADPVYGGQLQTRAVQGLKAEATTRTVYEAVPVRLADVTEVRLRRPAYNVAGLAHGPLGSQTWISPRLAPPMIGLGLVEQIVLSDLQALEDPHDLDGDGISGRIRWVVDPESGKKVAGRYGWKASRHSIRSQSASAFANDIGLSTTLFPAHAGDCTPFQPDCLERPHGAQPHLGPVEVPDTVLELVTAFVGGIAVPKRRDVGDAQVLEGKKLFYGAGCTSCHRPKFVTWRGKEAGANNFQLIWPYSDFLLHDMGDGLADGGGTELAREWRTPPLWGIGLTETVLGQGNYLHDGRARTLEEAILWHGGEARPARDAFAAMAKDRRIALIAFLKSL